MNTDTLSSLFADTPVKTAVYYDSIDSTNARAMESISTNSGFTDTLFAADEQTAGRGRFDRRWFTPKGSALAFTLATKPSDNELALLPLFSPLAGIAVCQAVSKYTEGVQIKWPNDILIKRKKVCGILTESVWDQGSVKGLAVGIGINVHADSVPPTDLVQFTATSIETHTKQQIDRWQLLKEVIVALYEWRSKLGSPDFFNYWKKNLAFVGEQVKIVSGHGSLLEGILTGVDADGNLLIEKNGHLHTVSVGDVHLRLAE